jgi:adenylate cyclase, class 2
MGLEIEAKMKVVDLEVLRLRLEAAGAAAAGEHLETNVFFDTSGGSLTQADKGLRLRTDRQSQPPRTRHLVTFKGPRQPGPLKMRQEIEFSVDDPGAATELFKELGMAMVLSFQKRRRSWTLLGCKVELDELPYLGSFVEIEGPAPEKVMHARQTLGLADQPIITSSYAALLGRHLEEHKIQSRTVEFPENQDMMTEP